MEASPNSLTLPDGLTIGEAVHTQAVLREPTAGQIIRAAREAEVVIAGADGRPALAISPTLHCYTMLCYQVERIGDYPGPLTLATLGKLSARDLEALQLGVALFDQAAGLDLDRLVQEALTRGRSDGAR